MADSSLLQPDESAAPVRQTRPPAIVVAVAAALLALLVAAGAWWFLAGRQAIPDWDRLTEIDLVAPAGDAFLGETPWVRLQITPARSGTENSVRVSLAATRGTPPVGQAPRILGMTAEALSAEAASPQTLALTPEADGGLVGSARFDQPGWWRLRVDVDGETAPAVFHLLIPDPNINGPNAVPGRESSSDGEALFQRGIDATTALRSVRFRQWIADGKGNAGVSLHAVTAGDGDSAPGLSYRDTGGMEVVIIGDIRWIKPPGQQRWQRQEGAVVVPPAEWGEEYSGATGFALLGEETIDGERCQLVAFVAPELTEPRRRTVAWYLWWVGTESGHVRQEAMVSRLHYMLNHFADFDAPLVLSPPDETATSVAGTPAG